MDELADFFMTCGDEIQERHYFASLAKCFQFRRVAKLKNLLASACQRARRNVILLPMIVAKTIYMTPQAAAALAENKDADVDDEQGDEVTTTTTSTTTTITTTTTPKTVPVKKPIIEAATRPNRCATSALTPSSMIVSREEVRKL